MKKLILIVTLLFATYSYGQDTTGLGKFIAKWIGKPYLFGGEDIRGIDCSAFVQRLYKDVFHIDIPRTCYYQYEYAKHIALGELRIGDILFFNSRVSPSGWHAGVYIGNDQFIHAANYRDGVKISCIDDYYRILKGVGRAQ